MIAPGAARARARRLAIGLERQGLEQIGAARPAELGVGDDAGTGQVEVQSVRTAGRAEVDALGADRVVRRGAARGVERVHPAARRQRERERVGAYEPDVVGDAVDKPPIGSSVDRGEAVAAVGRGPGEHDRRRVHA